MRVLVTGGLGYVGSLLLPRLVRRGHRVRCLDLRPASAAPVPGVEYAVGDIRDRTAMARALRGADGVIHLAAVVGYPACDAAPEDAWSINVEATRQLADLLPAGTVLVALSTCSVYGRVPGTLCHEEVPARPLTLYARSKLEAEPDATARGGVVLRPATAYGPSAAFRDDLIVHDFIARGLRGESLKLFQPEAVRAFVHVEDIAASAVFALEHAGAMGGRIYNVAAADSTLSKAELARLVAQATDLRIERDDAREDPDGRDYTIETARMTAAGFRPRHRFAQGLADTVAWMRTQLDAEPAAEA